MPLFLVSFEITIKKFQHGKSFFFLRKKSSLRHAFKNVLVPETSVWIQEDLKCFELLFVIETPNLLTPKPSRTPLPLT